MADRSFRRNTGTQTTKAVDYLFSILATGPTGTLGAKLGEGDPFSSYVSVQRGTSGITGVSGTTGTYLISSNDPFPGIIATLAQIQIVGQAAGTWTIEFGIPVQQVSTQAKTQINLATGASNIPGGNSTWLIPFTVFSSGTATDLPNGSVVCVHLRFRDSITNP